MRASARFARLGAVMSKDTKRRTTVREDVRTKGLRYLAESRVTIRAVSPDGIRASARELGAVYRLGYDRGRGWWCDCPARSTCCHLFALMSVTVQPQGVGR